NASGRVSGRRLPRRRDIHFDRLSRERIDRRMLCQELLASRWIILQSAGLFILAIYPPQLLGLKLVLLHHVDKGECSLLALFGARGRADRLEQLALRPANGFRKLACQAEIQLLDSIGARKGLFIGEARGIIGNDALNVRGPSGSRPECNAGAGLDRALDKTEAL